MKKIREQIKQGTLCRIYLLYGTESYLKALYRDKLIAAAGMDRESMNFSYFEGTGIALSEVAELIQTPPFLEPKRVVLLEDTGLCQKNSDLASLMGEIPEETLVIFVEKAANKSNALFRYISEHGYATELNGLEEEELRQFVAFSLKRYNLAISISVIDYFLGRVGTDMVLIRNELDKLGNFCQGREEVTREDIDTICIVVTETKVFEILNAMLDKNRKKAFYEYGQLLAMQESPVMILHMLNRSVITLSQCYELYESGVGNADICSILGLKPFVLKKYLNLKKKFPYAVLRDMIDFGMEMDCRIKSGSMQEHMAVEMYLAKYC